MCLYTDTHANKHTQTYTRTHTHKHTHIYIFLVLHFRWLDKLGVAARGGISVVVRQSLFEGNYALLDNQLQPNPVCK